MGIDYISIIESNMKIHLSMKYGLLLLAILSTMVYSQTADDDEVDTSVPGYPHKFYSGYIPLSVFENPKTIHYVFFPSQNDQTADPLIVWLTGGPGCSSLLACFHQNGPFIFQAGKAGFTLNQNSWNKKANLLYLQLPAGVGFSEGPIQQINDQTFSNDAKITLRLFFARFPAYKKNQLYLAGHGYAGVYITYLAKLIIEQNNSRQVIYNDNFKLKGILVGNPCTRPDECYASGSEKLSFYHYQFLHNRAYYTRSTWIYFQQDCLLNYSSAGCYQRRISMDKLFNATNSSMYNIYDKCYKSKTNSSSLGYVNTGCEDEAGLLTYLNDPHVKQNWNINPNRQWTPCNQQVYAKYIGKNNSYWIYPYLIKNQLRVWVYSGDLDSYVPIIGTKRWVEELRHELEMPVKRIWREWWVPGQHKGEDQVGGFIWELRDFTFVTVKGAGFRAGVDQPKAMSEILAGFLAGKTLPYKNE